MTIDNKNYLNFFQSSVAVVKLLLTGVYLYRSLYLI